MNIPGYSTSYLKWICINLKMYSISNSNTCMLIYKTVMFILIFSAKKHSLLDRSIPWPQTLDVGISLGRPSDSEIHKLAARGAQQSSGREMCWDEIWSLPHMERQHLWAEAAVYLWTGEPPWWQSHWLMNGLRMIHCSIKEFHLQWLRWYYAPMLSVISRVQP